MSQPSTRAAFFTLVALLACWPYLSSAGAANDFRDAQVLDHYESTARRTVLDYGQLPLWNPYSCGGLYALGSPQTRFASPTFLATLALGTSRAGALIQWLLVLLALEGTYRVLRSHRVNRLSAMLAAPVFGLSGIFACAPFLGWVSFCGFAALPWAVWGTQQALRGRRWGVPLVAACVAFMAGFGGTYTLPLTALACAAQFAAPLFHGRYERVVRVAGSLALATVGLSAFRLLPIWETLSHAPRTVASLESHGLPEIGGLLFGVSAPFFSPECWYLVGAPAAVLAAFELAHRRAWWLVAAAVACLWVAMGQALPVSLYGLLRGLPLFNMLRSPERFLVLGGLIIALGAGRALTSMMARARHDARLRWLVRAAVLALLVNAAMLIANFDAAARVRSLVAAPIEVQQPFHQARGNRWAVSEFGAQNLGSLSCWEAYPVPQSPLLRAGAPEEAWLEAPAAGSMQTRSWSPNRLAYQVKLTAPTTVVVNQNHHSGWRASVGTVVNKEGLLAVELPAGEHALTLSFRPRSAVVGFTVSLLMLVALGLALRFSSGVLVVPLIIGAVQFALIDEPWSKPLARGPEGEEVIVTAPPPGARVLDVDFEGGVRLEAASAARLAPDRLRLELDWSVPKHALSTLGIFVHFEPKDATSFNGDHPFISDALTFEELPVGLTARDIMVVSVPPEARGKALTIWAGVWALRGDGARQQVLTPTGATVDANRVQVAIVPALEPPDGGAP